MPRPRARAREGASTALLMPGTGKSCAASSRKQLCKQKSLQRLTRLAERLGAPSGRVCIFLLSTLRSRASSGYIRALLDFSNDVPPSWRARTSEEKDLWLCDFVLEQLEENVPPSRMRTLLAALQKIGLGKFRMPWRVLEGWTTLLPPTQAAALPEAVLRAFCSILVASHEHVVATVLVLCYFGVLRVSEALRLSPADVYFVDGAVLLYLARTKRGMEETVFIQDVFVDRWLRWYLVSCNQCKFQIAKYVSALLVRSDSAPAGILQCAPRSEHSPVHFPLVSTGWGNTSLHAQLADRVHRSLREVEERPQLPRISPQGRSLFDAIARGGEQRVLGFGGCLQ